MRRSRMPLTASGCRARTGGGPRSGSDFLSGCLGSYRPPSAASKAAVESGSVSYGGHTLQLNESIRKVTVAASAKLALDEVQTYALLRRCVDESGSPLPTELDDDLTERLTRYYFRERLGSLQCIRARPRRKRRERRARAPMFLSRPPSSPGSGGNLRAISAAHGRDPRLPVTLSSTSPALARLGETSARGNAAHARVRVPDVLRSTHGARRSDSRSWQLRLRRRAWTCARSGSGVCPPQRPRRGRVARRQRSASARTLRPRGRCAR